MWKKWVRVHLYSPLRKLTANREISRYVATTSTRKVNLGCGKNILPGWLNVDLYPHVGATHLNAASQWPVAEGTFQACICEHVIEHVPKPLGTNLLAQAFRSIAPGGTIRLITPDLRFYAQLILGQRSVSDERLYDEALSQLFGEAKRSLCDKVNMIFYEHDHRYIYTPQELGEILADIGFVDIVQTRAGEPRDKVFVDAEGHPKVANAQFNALEAFAMEARKPREAERETQRAAA